MHQTCIHRALYAVTGSSLADKKVPEESGPLAAAGREQDSHTSQLGRQAQDA